MGVFLLMAALLCAACPCVESRAADILPVTRVIEQIPRTSKELDVAHEKSNYACVLLPAGAPLAPARFESAANSTVVNRSRNATPAAAAPAEGGRWPALSFGVGMNKADQADLPRLTSRAILERVHNNYVCLQVRVDRLSPAGDPFLHYQPLAAVGEYGQPEQTEKFASLQQAAVTNVRSLGLFLKPGEPREPENLRTLVLSTKGSRIVPGDTADPPKLEPSLELMFVRLRIAPERSTENEAPNVEIHTFATTDDLKRLVYVVPYVTPEKLEECGLNSTIRLTEYSYGGQYPSARATRGLKYQARGRFELTDLDAYARGTGKKGGALDNLTEVLDAIIDGRLKARPE